MAYAYGGSKPPLPTNKFFAGVAQLVELHPSKVVVVGSSLIARFPAQIAQQVEHFLGKEEVHGFESRFGLF